MSSPSSSNPKSTERDNEREPSGQAALERWGITGDRGALKEALHQDAAFFRELGIPIDPVEAQRAGRVATRARILEDQRHLYSWERETFKNALSFKAFASGRTDGLVALPEWMEEHLHRSVSVAFERTCEGGKDQVVYRVKIAGKGYMTCPLDPHDLRLHNYNAREDISSPTRHGLEGRSLMPLLHEVSTQLMLVSAAVTQVYGRRAGGYLRDENIRELVETYRALCDEHEKTGSIAVPLKR